MSIKVGDVISHSQASEWGVGKIIELSPDRVTIHFNDGITRKIISSHFGSLLPAEPTLFKPVVSNVVLKVATKASPKGQKKGKP